MKHAIIVSHPRRRSFTVAMATAYQAALEARGHSVIVRDLYRMRFDPRLRAGELPDPRGFAPRSDVAAERKRLAEVEAFAFFYPVWFNAPPAMHKGYVDRVFGLGFGYGMGPLGSNEPLLSGRSMVSVSASGAPMEWVVETGAWEAMRKLFDEHFGAVCGLSVLDHVHFGGITPGLTREQMKLHAEVVRAKAAELF